MQPQPRERSSGEQAFRHAEGSRSVVERSMDLHLLTACCKQTRPTDPHETTAYTQRHAEFFSAWPLSRAGRRRHR